MTKVVLASSTCKEEEEEEARQAPGPTEVDTDLPTTPAEREILQYIYLSRRGARHGKKKVEEDAAKVKSKEFWVFFYKPFWGPNTKEMAARAVHNTWWQRPWLLFPSFV